MSMVIKTIEVNNKSLHIKIVKKRNMFRHISLYKLVFLKKNINCRKIVLISDEIQLFQENYLLILSILQPLERSMGKTTLFASQLPKLCINIHLHMLYLPNQRESSFIKLAYFRKQDDSSENWLSLSCVAKLKLRKCLQN